MGPPEDTRHLVVREHAGGALAALVHPLRRRLQPLRVRVEHGRREPGVRGHAGPRGWTSCADAPMKLRAPRPASSRSSPPPSPGWPATGRVAADPWVRLPEILARIRPPSFPARDFVLADFGGRGDGRTDATPAFRSAIEACHRAGGGRVVVPAGRVRDGPDPPEERRQPARRRGRHRPLPHRSRALSPAVFTRWEGVELMNYSPLVYAFDQQDIAITGEGTLDGQAERRALVAVEEDAEAGPRPPAPDGGGRRAGGGAGLRRRRTTCGRTSSSPTAAATSSSRASPSATRPCG